MSSERPSGRGPLPGGSGRSGKPARPAPTGTPFSDRVGARSPQSNSTRPPGAAARGLTSSGRAAAGAPEEDAHASRLKKGVLYATGGLFILFLLLLVVRGPALYRWITSSGEPGKHTVIDDNIRLGEVDRIAERAAREFEAAMRLPNRADRAKGIRKALETLSQAEEKLQELSEKYTSDDYDSVFKDKQQRMTEERILYRTELKKVID